MSKYTPSIFIFAVIFAFNCNHFNQGFVLGQTITLKSYNQVDSDTRCKYGLISGVDTVVFKAEIDYTEDTTMKFVQFYILRSTDKIPSPYITFNLQEKCQSYAHYSCTHKSPTTLDIEIRVKASKDYSGAQIYGKLFTSESNEINSDNQVFPQIFDSTDLSGRLIVNGKEIPINSEDCMIRLYEPEISIVFVCKSPASPCWTKISTNDSSTAAVEGMDLSIYNSRLEKFQDLFITIKYGVCSLNFTVNNFGCKITPEPRTSTDCKCSEFDLSSLWQSKIIILISLNSATLGALILLALLSCILLYDKSRIPVTKRLGMREVQNHHDESNAQLLYKSEKSSTTGSDNKEKIP